jgi:hypothetical protein
VSDDRAQAMVTQAMKGARGRNFIGSVN